MARSCWLGILLFACLFTVGCNDHKPKKPDPTKGVVTGIVLCADTGKPARFATVTLTAVPSKDTKSKDSAPLAAAESAITDLDGRFRIEAVEPGHYYAFATLEGYVDPMRSLDFTRLGGLSGDQEQELDAIKQWKDHLTEVTVHLRRTADLSLQLERGAEIGGTVTYDDGSPAIGMHFLLFRNTEKKDWTDVGIRIFENWALSEVSDSHGRFNLANLPAGEYKLCALMPVESDNTAPRVCHGNTYRKKDAKTIKVQSGEISKDADIVIPLSGLHTVAGTVLSLATGDALKHATVRLLYADDREKAREVTTLEDGSFSFSFVPEDKYILQVTGGQKSEQQPSDPSPGDAQTTETNTPLTHRYADKELPLTLQSDIDDLKVQLDELPPEKAQSPSAPPST
jgi:hypothetical protein